MRFDKDDIVFDCDIDVVDKDIIDGYLWATDKLIKLAEYNGCDDNDYINIYPCYIISKDKWYVEVSGVMNNKNFSKELELTKAELDYIANEMIKYYFGSHENWNDFVNEVKRR